MEKKDILGLSLPELKEELGSLGQPGYRAVQICTWLHQRLADDFSVMSDLSKALRTELSNRYFICSPKVLRVQVSGIDGTRKYLLGLSDGNAVEAVLMRYHHGNSVCISTQVGCRMGCSFCASTLDGCVRNLAASEMLAEVYAITRETGERVSNVVLMGSGEPLDNFDETVRFLRMISAPEGLNISLRNLTVSTCGIVPRMRELADLKLPITLAVSLHASSQEERLKIMPVARAYPLDELLSACRYYTETTGRRLTFEYSVVRGVNDSDASAKRLAGLIRGLHAHVNLIPVNPVRERDFLSPEKSRVERFRSILETNGVNATVRREMGRDIDSACGQLRRRYIHDTGLCSD